ncbi:MAG: translation elongation factor 4 [Clostridia bacterium]|nr:translation elongation factor 4 [Clostridia bacterium]
MRPAEPKRKNLSIVPKGFLRQRPGFRDSQVIDLSDYKQNIRNFSIIAHIDHGKSTLADRLLELTGMVAKRDMTEQLLDNMDLERERGITIKAHAVKLDYKAEDGQVYELNLIDTPGHVDFNYEVSRSLAACEGAVLIVDSTQGIEAQTLANTYLALDHDLEICPVINKIDLPAAHPEEVCKEVEDIIGLDCSEAPRVSAKTGENVEQVLEQIVKIVPPPTGDEHAPLRALIFDSIYDSYKGVIVYVRIVDGTIKAGDTMRLMSTGAELTVVEVGYMRAQTMESAPSLRAGEVGYITASIKTVSEARVGDTVTLATNPAPQALPGYRKVNPMVFCGIYPADGADYEALKEALAKLQLNDAALSFEPETSGALGFGFRCGFLGLLHLEIIQERLEREYDLDLVTTIPSVIYKIHLTNGQVVEIDNPSNYPDPATIQFSEEPIVNAHIYSPPDYVGQIMDLCQDRRGTFRDMSYITPDRVDIHYELPLNEIIYDFFDVLKSRTRGYASLDYEIMGYRQSDLVKLDVLLNGDQIDALSFIIHSEKAYNKARKIAEKLKENIPRQLFEIPIQMSIGGKIIARETVKAMRKDVLAKCYGGDITRKKKLLEKQKEGKKRMRQFGTVEVPQEAFMAVLKLDD